MSGTTWTHLGQDIDGESSNDSSGYSVSLSSDGSRVAIGAIFNDGNGNDSGHTRVYQWSGTTWTQLGQDIDGESSNDWSGYVVSLSADGSRVAITAINNDGNGNNSGHTRVYQWSGTTWKKIGQDIDGESSNDLSGYAVSLSSDGYRVAIGAINNDGNGNNSGHTRIYEFDKLYPMSIENGVELLYLMNTNFIYANIENSVITTYDLTSKSNKILFTNNSKKYITRA